MTSLASLGDNKSGGAEESYIELHTHSAYSFLRGASSPAELVTEALRLGLEGLAITDNDGFYGAAQFYEAARGTGLKTLYGAELTLELPRTSQDSLPERGDLALEPRDSVPGWQSMAQPQSVLSYTQQYSKKTQLLVLARGLAGYRQLSSVIGAAQLAGGKKGQPHYDLNKLTQAADGQWLILTGGENGAVARALASGGMTAGRRALAELIDQFGRDNVAVELTHHQTPGDDERIDALVELASRYRVPIVATTAAHYATPAAARAASAFTAIRARSSLAEAEQLLPAGPGSYLRSAAEMKRIFQRYPEAVINAAQLGSQCAFDLHLAAPQLPPFNVPSGETEASYLRILTMRGAAERYGTPAQNPQAYAQLERELHIITELDFPGYFLVVYDIVQFCRRSNILCQGRGSAANSAVCFALGITAVDAVRYQLLFERFLSPVREGPPDIDVDIESDRREEVIQYVYRKYGRKYAAQVANVATYRPKMAVRDAAKALGYSPGQQDAYSKRLQRHSSLNHQVTDTAGRSGGKAEHIPPDVINLARYFENLPRHLGIHSGGMVICDRPIAQVVPVEWARKEGRSVLQWDKDDCAAMGLVKFDLLGLGMLSALHYTVDFVREHEGIDIDFAQLGLDDPAVYAMLSKADTVGVFQVESRAQMATLPRLKPEHFYDLVVEIALIRPGPIQGGSVHPYLQRRDAVRDGTWRGDFVEHPAMARALNKTLGIPLFQEQLMELAIDVAGFDAGEADLLRKALSSKRSTERMEQLRGRLYEGMHNTHGITGALADKIYRRILAFAGFGFAESHALSFASLVYYSAYLKRYHPAAFLAGLLRAQPMGFYSPQTLVADARRHGVTVYRAHVNHSGVQADLAPGPGEKPAVRLGLAGVRGISAVVAEAIVAARPTGGYRDIESLAISMTTPTAAATGAAGSIIPTATPGAASNMVLNAVPNTAPNAAPNAAQNAALNVTQWESLATAGALDGLVDGSNRPGGAGKPDKPGGAGKPDNLDGTGRSGDVVKPGSAGDIGESDKLGGARHKSARRRALWVAGAAASWQSMMLPGTVSFEAPNLPGMSEAELTVSDIWATGISPDHHPMEFSREQLDSLGVVTAAALAEIPTGTRVLIAGMVTHRQRPPTAAGVTFLNIEDDTGMINVIVTAGLWRRYRKIASSATAMIIRGVVQRSGEAVSFLADRLGAIETVATLPSRDFR